MIGWIDHGGPAESVRREVVAVARENPNVEIHDLFERFIPEAERVKRLGDVIDRASLLKLRGDAARGQSIFTTNSAVQCKSCHKVGNVGGSVGPALNGIGLKYDRIALLDQILDPSRTIDPRYVSYMLETKDGRVLTGLLVQRSASEVVLEDAQGKTIRVPSGEVEKLVSQQRSLMPELLLRDLTAQQVADLLEYLTTLR